MELETILNGKKGIMHCVNCGKTDFSENTIYNNYNHRWFTCLNCGVEFRTANNNIINDDKIYLNYSLILANED